MGKRFTMLSVSNLISLIKGSITAIFLMCICTTYSYASSLEEAYSKTYKAIGSTRADLGILQYQLNKLENDHKNLKDRVDDEALLAAKELADSLIKAESQPLFLSDPPAKPDELVEWEKKLATSQKIPRYPSD
ncbi:MAG: hypothetical protein ACI85H_001142 [Paracoccaceae bacterium]|jgi:hypothetical protein